MRKLLRMCFIIFFYVIPAKAGIQYFCVFCLDSRLRGNDRRECLSVIKYALVILSALLIITTATCHAPETKIITLPEEQTHPEGQNLILSKSFLQEFPDIQQSFIKDSPSGKVNFLLQITVAGREEYSDKITNDNIAALFGAILSDPKKGLTTEQKITLLEVIAGNYAPWYKCIPEAGLHLLKLLRDEIEVVQMTVKVLGELGYRPAIPELMKLLSHDSVLIRRQAIESLGQLNARDATEEIVKFLNDEDGVSRAQGIRVINQFGIKETTPRLMELLSDNYWRVRRESARALGDFSEKQAIPQLTKLLSDKDKSVCQSTFAALIRLGSGDKAISKIITLVRTGKNILPVFVASVLRESKSPELIAEIRGLLKDANIGVRELSLEILTLLGDQESIPALRELLNDDLLRDEVIQSLRQLGDETPINDIYLKDVIFLLDELEKRCTHFFELKKINWSKMREKFTADAKRIADDVAHIQLCQRLIARLKDGHAYLKDIKVKIPEPPQANWVGPGMFWALKQKQVLVKSVWGPAEESGITAGLEIVSVDNVNCWDWLLAKMSERTEYIGESTFHQSLAAACHWGLKGPANSNMTLKLKDKDGKITEVAVTRDRRGGAGVPEGPVFPPEKLKKVGRQQYGKTAGGFGYIHLRNIPEDLPEQFDTMLEEVKDTPGLILDMRSNGGGGCDHQAVFGRFLKNGEKWGVFDPFNRNLTEIALNFLPIKGLGKSSRYGKEEGYAFVYFYRQKRDYPIEFGHAAILQRVMIENSFCK